MEVSREALPPLLRGMAGEIFFVGIGGSGMYGTAALAHAMGFSVRGTDTRENANTARLRRMGIPLQSECEALPRNTALLVYSFAVSPRHPLLLKAGARGIPRFDRAAFLGMLMHAFPIRAAVAGSHGKSSTTAMCAEILDAAGCSPTVLCGADLGGEDGGFRRGRGNILLFEACEYRDAFLSFCPTHALALGVSYEHTDYFSSEEGVRRSFLRYLSKETVQKSACPVGLFDASVPYGEGGALWVEQVVTDAHGSRFLLCKSSGERRAVSLRIPGAFQVENALGAAALATTLSIPDDAIVEGLCRYRGIARRFELKGCVRGAPLYLDFAHHPKELFALLRSAQALGRPVALVFEPHTYSRTKSFFDDYARALSLSHMAGVLPVYAARERDTGEVSGKMLAEAAHAAYLRDYRAASRFLIHAAGKGCTLLLVGAGGVEGVLPYLSGMLLPVKA